MIAHHPDDTLLMAYASGTADEATGLIIATHLHYCSACRIKSAQLETIGGSLLEEIAPQAMAAGALEATLAKLDQILNNEKIIMDQVSSMRQELNVIKIRVTQSQ